MSARFSSARARRSFLLVSGALTAAAGGTALYRSSRPPARKPEQVPKLSTDANGQIIAPKFPSIPSRSAQLASLRQHSSASTEYDLLVIGGGATGAGIALDAVTRGLKVALIERSDFSSGTSSKSTKLVHGGVRYLEKAVWNLDYGQLQLVREALQERRTFLDIAPHLSCSLPVMLPLVKWWQVPYFWVGAKAYDLLAGPKGLESSYFMTRRKALETFPLLRKNGLVGALVYYDGQHNDSRMNISVVTTASLYGATVLNYAEVTGLEKSAEGKICGAVVRDVLPARNDREPQSSEEFIVRAKGIINATGPFADAVEKMDDPERMDLVAPSRGVHISLPRHLCPSNMGLLDPSTSDGRVAFLLPWHGTTIAGTTDTPCTVQREDQVASEQDIEFILKELRKYLSPDVEVSRSDVLAAWSGIRPLVRDPNAKNTESLVRRHLVSASKSGLLTCAGGKWTTYRRMAQDAVDEAIQIFNLTPTESPNIDISGVGAARDIVIPDSGSCQTQRIRLVGAHGFHSHLRKVIARRYNLDDEVAEHLALNYGDRAWEVASLASTQSRLSPNFPYLEAEIVYGIHQEYAQTASDVIARRTRLSFLDVNAALEALPRVLEIMAQELDWSEGRRNVEWTETVHFLTSMGLAKEHLTITKEQVLRGEHRRPIKGTIKDSSPGAQLHGNIEQTEQTTTYGAALSGSGSLS